MDAIKLISVKASIQPLKPVANDNVFVTVNLYESGVLDAQTAIARLKAYKTYDQLSFHTEKVIKTLRFVESIEV